MLVTMGVQSATLFLQLCIFVVIALLISLWQPAEALRKASTLNLASMRIYTAELQLRESGRAAAVLEHHCQPQLESVRDGLHRASTKVVVNPDGARRDLVLVDAFLQTCSQNLSATVNSQAYDLLTRVGQSVASAEYLIDQSDIFAESITKAPSQEVVTSDVDSFEGDGNDSTLRTNVDDGWETGGPVPMDDLVTDFCPNHVGLTRSSATIRLDRACGGKFHTRAKYASGVFTVRMRAPSGAPGVGNSFYISSNDAEPDVISFDFVGEEPNRVLTAYAVRGDHAHKLKTFHMDFDTTAAFHDYTIKWDAASIVWMVDGVVLRTLRAKRPFPTKPGHVYGYSWDATRRVDWRAAPFLMRFHGLQVASPLQWRRPRRPESSPRGSIRPLVIDYCPGNIAAHHLGVDITFDSRGCGGRVRSLRSYPSGRFSARIRCADGDTSGLLTSFYLSSGEGSRSQDEIDFEFLGDNKRIVQTNFYVNGSSAYEQWVELDHDCSKSFHTYTIDYSPQRIHWLVDERLVRTVEHVPHSGLAFPRKSMFLYSSVWNASFVNDGGWTGKWHGMGDAPFVAKFRDVTMTPF